MADPRIDQTIDDLGHMIAREELGGQGASPTELARRAMQIAASIRAFITAQREGYALTITELPFRLDEVDPDDPMAQAWGDG